MVDVAQGGIARVGTVRGGRLLGEQARHAKPVDAAPDPKLPGLGVLRMAVVAKVLVHRRQALAQRVRKALVEGIVRRYAMRDGLGPAQQQVAARVSDHVLTLGRSGTGGMH